MTMKQERLNEFEEWTHYVTGISNLDWDKPLDLGKWTIHDLVSHIMLWDKYFLEVAIEPITNNEQLSLMNLDFNTFNQDAMKYGTSKTKSELLEMTIEYRTRILKQIRDHEEEKFTKEFIDADGNKFTVEAYLKDFIEHDRQHMNQIEERKE